MMVLWVITPFGAISSVLRFKWMCWLHFWGAWMWSRWIPKRLEGRNNWYFSSSQLSLIPTVDGVHTFLWG